ncbi:MAG: pyrroloquinoline quinone-dependent dehydrogenase [Gammaproteobacteria bacterium]|nr:pyrroloquinoline quinone-dependent dehydrogenase [Gammaproteobacteria bacterium]
MFKPAPLTARAGTRVTHYAVIIVILLACSSNAVAQEQNRRQSGNSRDQITADDAMHGWPVYGGAPGGGQYSPLSRIDRHNVRELEIAWVYHSGDVSDGADGTAVTPLEVNPILANDRLYLCTPFNRIVALDPATGTEEWSHDPGIDRKNTYSRGSYCRGVAYWSEAAPGDREQVCGKRVLSGIGDGRLVAVDADTGRPCSDFGKNGQIDLNTFDYHGEGSISLTSPPAIYRDVVIVGATILDGEWANAPDGIVRGFDVRSGRELWNWNPIPEHLRDTLGGANTWAPISIDSRRGWVFLPTGSPSHDPYGLHRPGSIPHGNAVVALDALTGEEIWSYQTLRHDLWDYDLPSMPALVELDRNGSKTEAVLQATKTGFFFILDRDTGRSLFPVKEMKVPQSDVEGEKSSPVQPAPLMPPPFTAQSVTADDAWGLTPWDRKQCRDKILALRNEGLYTPPSVNGSVLFPSDSGGSNWGGVAYDPESGLAVINSTNVLRSQKLAPRREFEASGGQQKTAGRSSVALMPGTPYVWIRETLVSDLGIPCNPPPWGNLTAIDTHSGEIRWQIPFGRKPFGFGLFRSPKKWGSPNQGGPIITGGGLIFIGASIDNRFRAYDLHSGKELWSAEIPAPGNATPMTYLHGGSNRQFVVIAAGGYPTFGTELSDAIVAFALPEEPLE